ncbi:MAG: helix-turn-helix transcriptional regulator [Pirellulaceae bacterium]|nr:helix-turn-helix transcriptional regulator [Pirellulaceae bacterium]
MADRETERDLPMAAVNDLDRDVLEPLLVAAGRIVRAFMECSDEIQQGVRAMFEIIADPDADPDDRDMAVATVKDALFPEIKHGPFGLDLEESERVDSDGCEWCHQILDEMDREEASFADRLHQIMKERGVSQTELAEKLRIGQPAISNMLKRQCRPQRNTVKRLAEALGVSPQQLWPDF